MKQRCTLPSSHFILHRRPDQDKRGREDDTSSSSPVDQPLDKRVNVDSDPQDALHLGSEAALLNASAPAPPPMTGMGRRETSPHALAAVQAVADHLEEERKEHKRIIALQGEQMRKMQEQIEAEMKRRDEQQRHEQARAQAVYAQQLEERQMRELQQKREEMRREFEQLRLENEKVLESMRDTLQQQRIDSGPTDDSNQVPPRGRKGQSPRQPRPPHNPFNDEADDLVRIINDSTMPKYAVNAAMDFHQQRRANLLVNDPVTAAISEESTMRRKMMALQRAQESRPAKKFNNGDSLAFRSLMSRFDAAVNDAALDDASRPFELFHWFEGSAAAMIDSFASLPDAKQAYKSARDELKNVFGASSDSVVPLIRELLAGNAVKEDDHQAHLLLYSQLVTADTTATSLGQRNLLDRFDYCAEIIEKRLPHLAERWWRKDHEHQMCTGSRFAFNHLKEFVMVATKICASRQNLKRASVFKCNAQDPQPALPQPETLVQQKQPTDECQECGDAHKTEECPILLAMPMEECSKHISQRH